MKVKVKIPTDLSDIKLSQYQKFHKTTEGKEDMNFINKQMVAIFCQIPDEYVNKISKKDYDSIIQTINKLFDHEPKLKPLINYNGKRLGFIPKLEDITVGEQADVDTLISDWGKMDKVMAILYREIETEQRGKYTIKEYTGEEEPIDVTMDIVFGAMVFFYQLLNDLLTYTQSYIEEEVRKTKTSQILEENGIGINQFMQSLEVTFSSLKKSLNYDYMKPYSG